MAVRRRFGACSLRAFLREECPFLIFNRRSSRFLIACVLAITACEKPHVEASAVTDDFGDAVRLDAAPTRIVSLNPATTELLFALAPARVWSAAPSSIFGPTPRRSSLTSAWDYNRMWR